MLNKIIKFFLENRLITVLLLLGLVGWGMVTSPFRWEIDQLPTDPVPVDAIPDIGENQQIIYTSWPGRSPQDIEDQISYPLTTYLLGVPGVKSVRSSSIFGFSNIYLIFEEDVEFYWSRSRILEKINALPSGLLPPGVQPTLGPDATALGQVFWYTLEGRDKQGRPTGGWDLQEIRSQQDFYIKYALSSAQGVAEVASIGGFVKEYQVDVNPDALQAYKIPLQKVVVAIKESNRDVGAKTVEINQAEYLVRGLGYIKSIDDLAKAVVDVQNNVPITLGDIAQIKLGPANRRGVLDKDGAEVVGGVVVARYGTNPLKAIEATKAKIKEIAPGLPKKTLADGTESQLTIVPFYDRSELIQETLGTLEEALSLQILISVLVISVMVYRLRAALLISVLLPIAVLMVFVAMRYVGVDANIVALSGIAIAIGTMVDLGIILTENMLKHLDEAEADEPLLTTIYRAAAEVSSAIVTAVTTTVISFIPVFALQAAEGKLFGPLAYTKTFALVAALIVALFILPTLAYFLFGLRTKKTKLGPYLQAVLVVGGVWIWSVGISWAGVVLLLFGVFGLLRHFLAKSPDTWPKPARFLLRYADLIAALLVVLWLLSAEWLPLGAGKSDEANLLFVAVLVGGVLAFFLLIEKFYIQILEVCLRYKAAFLSLPSFLLIFGATIWLGFSTVFGWFSLGLDGLGINAKETAIWQNLSEALPGMGKEFMPTLNEGSFLLMPTSMPHSGMAYNRQVLGQLDMLLTNIPEVALTVGKLGRAESALDPAPISMFENVINYKSEYLLDEDGRRRRFKTNEHRHFVINTDVLTGQDMSIPKGGIFISGGDFTYANAKGKALPKADQQIWATLVGSDLNECLVADKNGQYFRNWRSHIQSPDDIWQEIVRVTKIPGITSAPKLQPIETRLVMLQTGMRAPMGIKVFGPDLPTIESFTLKLEELLKTVPSVKKEAVFADRIVGKPYMHINIDRTAIARYGLSITDVQQVIETAIGGLTLTSTVQGRERYAVRLRYPRELRQDPESIAKIYVPTKNGRQIPLGQLVEIDYVRGPQMIKSEETFLVGYVLFDRNKGFAEVSVVEDAQAAIAQAIESNELTVPAGVSYRFSGSYENQLRAEKRLSILIPLVLAIIFLVLYLQFRSVATALMVFSGVAVAFSGGFIVLWLYGQPWFADFTISGINFRDLFQMGTINLSVAVWVGFIALFGIATDDGVLMATYLDQRFRQQPTQTLHQLRETVLEAGAKRIRPAVMTSATTLIALLPILTSTGRGSDIMVPMAIPAFGGMLVAASSYFMIPVLYAIKKEKSLGN